MRVFSITGRAVLAALALVQFAVARQPTLTHAAGPHGIIFVCDSTVPAMAP